MSSRNLTIRDIAREAGVSPATVSRHLTGSARLRAETSERIQAVIDRHAYTPNILARSLSSRSSGVIGLIVPEIDNLYFARLALAIEQAAAAADFEILLCNTLDSIDREIRYARRLRSRQVDAIILAGGATNRVALAAESRQALVDAINGIPTVIVNGTELTDEAVNVNSVHAGVSDFMVGQLAALGCRSFAFLGGQEGITSFDYRVAALERALDRHGLGPGPAQIIPSGFGIDGGVEAAEALLATGESLPDAVVAVNDNCAAGILQVFHRRGVDVPGDVVVLGLDDIPLAKAVQPTLSTFAHPYDAIARQVLTVIADRLAGHPTAAAYDLPMYYIERRSCCFGLSGAGDGVRIDAEPEPSKPPKPPALNGQPKRR